VPIKISLPIQSMYEDASPGGAPEENIHKAALSLCFRSLDFHEQRHDGSWKLGEIPINSATVVK
jgi:hypothetical protein